MSHPTVPASGPSVRPTHSRATDTRPPPDQSRRPPNLDHLPGKLPRTPIGSMHMFPQRPEAGPTIERYFEAKDALGLRGTYDAIRLPRGWRARR
jgi:hypothetical protein